MRLGKILAGVALLAPAIASAEAPRIVAPEEPAHLFDIVAGPANADGYQLGRQVVPPSPAASLASLAPMDGTAGVVAQSRTIYLNKSGVTLTPGTNDSRLNHSSIVTQQTSIPAWNVSASTWSATVQCMREVFAPFNVDIVEGDPGNVPHMEVVFGGSPQQLGMTTNLAGVSPFTTDCSIVENSIVFAFMGVLEQDPRLACEVAAQEVAHSYGLDHVLIASEIMTYLPYDGRRFFQNMEASCGEDKARPCGLNSSNCRPAQNSVSVLIERVGLKGQAGDTVPPTLAISSPHNGDTVPPTFTIKLAAGDNAKVLMTSLYVDGKPSGSGMIAPFSITTPAGLTEGAHKLRVVATDGINESSQELVVNVSKDAASDGQEDVMGGCAAGSGSAGAGAGLVMALGALVWRRRRG